MGIDPGSNWGWAVADKKSTHVDYGSSKFLSLAKFEGEVLSMTRNFSVTAVVTCRAMGKFSQVIRYHAAMAAIVELTCEKHDIPYCDIGDGKMRKEVMGKGNAKKVEVMEYCAIDNEHAADAMVGALYLAKVFDTEII